MVGVMSRPLRIAFWGRYIMFFLMDYKWSSYPAYTYGKKAPAWLKRRIILSQFEEEDPQLAYRRKVQR